MKKQILCALLIGATYTPSFAQPSPVKKAAQSVFSLTTFKQGNIIATTNGVFTANGEALSMWHPFVDADSAVVVDSKGNKYIVESLLGANDIYDLCKFRIKPLLLLLKPSPTAARRG